MHRQIKQTDKTIMGFVVAAYFGISSSVLLLFDSQTSFIWGGMTWINDPECHVSTALKAFLNPRTSGGKSAESNTGSI